VIRLAKVTALVLATILGLVALWELRGPLLIFLLSLVVAAAARVPVDSLIRLGLPKSVALAATYGLGLLTLAGLLVAVLFLLSGELPRATEDFKRLYDDAARHVASVPWIRRVVNERLPPADQLLTTLVGRHGEQAARLVLGTAFGVLSAGVDVVFVIVLSIYWTIDHAYFEGLWLSLLPLPRRISARTLWRTLEAELGAYARSEIAQSLLAGIVLGLGFYLLRLDHPALVATVACLSWLVPWLGAIIALMALVVVELPALILKWPGSLLSVTASALFTVLVFVILESGLEPRLFNRRRYNSLFTVLAAIALAKTFGVLGLLLGPMAAVTIQAAMEHCERDRVAARRPASDLAALEARTTELRAGAAAGPGFPQEWTSILDRLAALIVEARAMAGDRDEDVEENARKAATTEG
jgi:predicted PurR-regulated permease PerM